MSTPELGEVTALVPVAAESYLARIATDAALHAQQQLVIAYDKAVRMLIGPNDVQKAQGKEFKKKSAWRKLARYFEVSTQIIREETHREEDGHLVATVIVRAILPTGQYAEAIGKCSTRESRFRNDVSKADHDCPATAQTRATNRAVSDLIAAGEVSAEEMEFGEIPQHANHAPAVPAQGSPSPASTPEARPASTTPGADSYAPTDKQVAFYRRLVDSPVFTAEEKKRALNWLASATRQTIKDQIDWLKRQVETRKAAPQAHAQAEQIRNDLDSFAEMPGALQDDTSDPW